MSQLAPIAVATPLVVAAVLAGIGERLHRRVYEVLAISAAVTTTAVCAILMAASFRGPLVYWMGGWAPRQGLAIGIDLAVDPIGAGLGVLTGILLTAALVFAMHYFDEARSRFQVLMLAVQAGLTGFGLTGDLFNLFVFFELMSAPSYALAGYRSEDDDALQGALNMGVVNTIGAFLVLMGISLLYGRTGALNLAQIGRALTGRSDGLVVAAFSLIACGFLVKAAIVPFHFWLADAHAVAPTPVCVLFSGVMVSAGLFAVARMWGAVFQGALEQHAGVIRMLLLGTGAVTAVIGSVLAFVQRHLKRLLAFSTIAHMGWMLVGFSALSPEATAGVAIYAAGHGLIKGSLFLCMGTVLHRLRSVDELALRGRGRDLQRLGALCALGGLALAAIPATALFRGDARMEEALGGRFAIAALSLFVSAMTGGAVLRAAARVFIGLGPAVGVVPEVGGEPTERPETLPEPRGAAALAMLLPAATLLALSVALGFVPGLGHRARVAAALLMDGRSYAAIVLDHASPSLVVSQTGPPPAHAFALGALASVMAVAVAALALGRDRLPAPSRRSALALRRALEVLRAWQSGDLRDYVAWLVFGAAVFGIVCLALI